MECAPGFCTSSCGVDVWAVLVLQLPSVTVSVPGWARKRPRAQTHTHTYTQTHTLTHVCSCPRWAGRIRRGYIHTRLPLADTAQGYYTDIHSPHSCDLGLPGPLPQPHVCGAAEVQRQGRTCERWAGSSGQRGSALNPASATASSASRVSNTFQHM